MPENYGTNTSGELAPITAGERLLIIDILRGVAILGILLLNIDPYSFPFGFDSIYLAKFTGIADKIVYWGTQFLFQGRFATMLTLLLGVGTAVQVARAQARGKAFSPLYARRMFFLLLIGVLHDLILWSGIILPIFGTLGFILLFFQNRKPRTLIVWLLIFWMVAPTILIVKIYMRPSHAPERPAIQNAGAAEKQKQLEEQQRKYDNIVKLYGEGDYTEMFRNRWEVFVKETIPIIYRWGWMTVGVFLLGMWVWRRGILQDVEANIGFLKKVLWYSLILGVVGVSYSYLSRYLIKPSPSLFFIIGRTFIRQVGTVSFTVFLMTVVVLLNRKDRWKKILKPLAAVGRMAFSNYVFQTVLCTTFFYAYGFGMFGKTGPVVNLLVVFIVWSIQVPLSVWWLRRFSFGPVEWLWRSLTYGRCQPMKRNGDGHRLGNKI